MTFPSNFDRAEEELIAQQQLEEEWERQRRQWRCFWKWPWGHRYVRTGSCAMGSGTEHYYRCKNCPKTKTSHC